MAEENTRKDHERLSIMDSENGALLSMETTEVNLSRWLDSDTCTLEAVGLGNLFTQSAYWPSASSGLYA